MTTWANIEDGPKRNVTSPIDCEKQSANRASGTVSGSYVALFDNSLSSAAVIAYVLTQQNAQFQAAVSAPADDTRSYVVLANGTAAFVIPAGQKLFYRDLS